MYNLVTFSPPCLSGQILSEFLNTWMPEIKHYKEENIKQMTISRGFLKESSGKNDKKVSVLSLHIDGKHPISP